MRLDLASPYPYGEQEDERSAERLPHAVHRHAGKEAAEQSAAAHVLGVRPRVHDDALDEGDDEAKDDDDDGQVHEAPEGPEVAPPVAQQRHQHAVQQVQPDDTQQRLVAGGGTNRDRLLPDIKLSA